jgi:hypothetical protein
MATVVFYLDTLLIAGSVVIDFEAAALEVS